jgi:fatty-acyl-CoA synthase
MKATVPEILARRAMLTPERVAVLDWDCGREVRYLDLEHRANTAASFLQRMGIGKGDRVSILAKNGIHYVDMFFALGKIGAIFTPLSFRLAQAELEYLVNDSTPRILFYGPEYEQTALELKRRTALEIVVNLDDYERILKAGPTSTPMAAEISAEDPHSILYTSGTTGRPKGAILSHRMIVWNSFNTIVSWGLREDDRGPIFTPQYHSGGLNVLMVSLFHIGGSIILTRTFDPDEALKIIEHKEATIVFMVPTMFQMMADSSSFERSDLISVRFYISGGAPCPLDLMEVYRQRGGVFKQGFGMTEVGVNCFTMTAEESVKKAGSVGKPIFHSRATILDEAGCEVGLEEVGELVISGRHLFSGYWQRENQTAQVLNEGWFHTGDLARRDKDGFFYIVGRKKDMIISGGENVYLAEVESVICSHPAVKEAAVIGVPDAKWGEVGHAIVVLREATECSEEEIGKFCEGRLARFKIPKSFVFTDSLPRNPYGKLVRKEIVA